MTAILIDDLDNVQVLESDQALFITDGPDGSPYFIECVCGHVMLTRDAVGYDGTQPCPNCK